MINKNVLLFVLMLLSTILFSQVVSAGVGYAFNGTASHNGTDNFYTNAETIYFFYNVTGVNVSRGDNVTFDCSFLSGNTTQVRGQNMSSTGTVADTNSVKFSFTCFVNRSVMMSNIANTSIGKSFVILSQAGFNYYEKNFTFNITNASASTILTANISGMDLVITNFTTPIGFVENGSTNFSAVTHNYTHMYLNFNSTHGSLNFTALVNLSNISLLGDLANIHLGVVFASGSNPNLFVNSTFFQSWFPTSTLVSRITLNVSVNSGMPQIFKDGQLCDITVCTHKVYSANKRQITFTATGFSTYNATNDTTAAVLTNIIAMNYTNTSPYINVNNTHVLLVFNDNLNTTFQNLTHVNVTSPTGQLFINLSILSISGTNITLLMRGYNTSGTPNASSFVDVPLGHGFLTNGTWKFNISVVNEADILGTTHGALIVDKTPPADIIFNHPVLRDNKSTTDLTFNFTVYDDITATLNCNLSVDHVFFGTMLFNSTNNSLTTSFTNTTGLFDGSNHSFNVTCFDGAKNSRFENNLFTVDRVKPQAVFEGPRGVVGNNTYYTENSLHWRFAAKKPWFVFNLTDELTHVLNTTVEFSTDGGDFYPISNGDTSIGSYGILSDAGNRVKFNFSRASAFTDGNHTITIRFNDSAHNTQSTTFSFIIDETRPSVNSITTTTQTVDQSANVTLTIDAGDNILMDNVTSHLTIMNQGGSKIKVITPIKFSYTGSTAGRNGTYVLSIPVTDIAAGTYFINGSLFAADQAGNNASNTLMSIALGNTLNFTVTDSSAPVISKVFINVTKIPSISYNGNGHSLNLTVNFSEATNISSAWFTINSETVQLDGIVGSNRFNNTYVLNLTAGSYDIVVYANDTSGNGGTSGTTVATLQVVDANLSLDTTDIIAPNGRRANVMAINDTYNFTAKVFSYFGSFNLSAAVNNPTTANMFIMNLSCGISNSSLFEYVCFNQTTAAYVINNQTGIYNITPKSLDNNKNILGHYTNATRAVSYTIYRNVSLLFPGTSLLSSKFNITVVNGTGIGTVAGIVNMPNITTGTVIDIADDNLTRTGFTARFQLTGLEQVNGGFDLVIQPDIGYGNYTTNITTAKSDINTAGAGTSTTLNSVVSLVAFEANDSTDYDGTSAITVRFNVTALGGVGAKCSTTSANYKIYKATYNMTTNVSSSWTGLTTTCSEDLSEVFATVTSFSAFALGNITTASSSTTTTTTSSTSSSSGGGVAGLAGTTGPSKSYAVDQIAADTPWEKTIETSSLDVSKIKIDVKQTATNVDITIKQLNGVPEISVLPEGSVYTYLEFTLKNLPNENIEKADIEFKVRKTWLAENGIEESSLTLQQHENDVWTELVSTKVKDDATYVYYTASTQGFSYFAITGKTAAKVAEEKAAEEVKKAEEAAAKEEARKTTVGIVIAIVLVVIGLIVYFKKRR